MLTNNKAFQNKFKTVIFDQIDKDFGEYIDAQARVKPKQLHHVYEWDKIGNAQARLFKLKRIDSGQLSFKVSNDKSVTLAGIPYFYNQNGGNKWIYTDESVINATSNVNIFANVLGNTLIKLPSNPRMGDMIRIIDVGGNLNNITSLVIRAPDSILVQGTLTNTARTLLSGVGTSTTFINYNGGELVVQTPFAGFALVYLSSANPDGTAGSPASRVGWYLTEV